MRVVLCNHITAVSFGNCGFRTKVSTEKNMTEIHETVQREEKCERGERRGERLDRERGEIRREERD